MLDFLSIENIVLIDKAEIEFKEGLNVLTGETGAGKSIIINSIKFILGEKPSVSILRDKEKRAKVTVSFSNINNNVVQYLNDIGIEDTTEIILERELNPNGKTLSRINSQKVTNAVLKNVTQLLLDLSSQNESIQIMNENQHVVILDSFLKKELKDLKEEFSVLYKEYKNIKNEINNLNSLSLNESELNYLKTVLEELKNADIKVGEDEELTRKKEINDNSQSIISYLYSSLQLISENDEQNILLMISFLISNISSLSKFSNNLKDDLERLESIQIDLQDISANIEQELSNVQIDEEEANYIQDRLSFIKKIKRKFNLNEEQLIEYIKEVENKIDNFDNFNFKIEKLEKQKILILDKIYSNLNKINDIRKEKSKLLEEEVNTELKDLYMKDAVFKVNIKELPNREEIEKYITKDGFSNINFLMSVNKGQELTALSKSISGGEMSRLTLALKLVLQDTDSIETVIFDEIDTGISGLAALTVGKKLAKLSKTKQIILVSHLSQIAALSDTHFKIEKYEEDSKTITKINELSYEEKILEIARLVSGNITELSKEQAKELIDIKRRIQ